MTHSNAQIDILPEQKKIVCTGRWTVSFLSEAEQQVETFSESKLQQVTIDGSKIEGFDTIGAWVLHKLCAKLTAAKVKFELTGFNQEQLSLLKLMEQQGKELKQPPPQAEEEPTPTYKVGVWTVEAMEHAKEFLAFLGETVIVFANAVRRPKRIRWRALLNVIEFAGYRAVPIIALLSFLIGMVLVYQMGIELNKYGANIFVTDILGIALLRELSPLLTAIIVAGRTGSSFTAQIGTMKVSEEIDALRTFGLSPAEVLLLPRMMALIIVLPLLTAVSEIFGILGGMVIAKSMLNIQYSEFLRRFQEVILLKTYLLGLIKVPLFAMIISMVGCFQGLKVVGSAESVGQRTTISVVQAIFLIIVTDAFVSVVYSWYGL